MDKNGRVLVVFGEELPKGDLSRYDAVIAGDELNEFTEPGSIYEASAFAEELSHLKLDDGSRIAKSFNYKGYELWWLYYSSLFLFFCLPYTQYKKLLLHLKDFQSVSFYEPPYKSLFSCYLEAHGCKVTILRSPGFKSPSFLPFGVFLQILITLLSIPILMVRRRHTMLSIGDKFEKSEDYDFRMKFMYEDLRQKGIPFVEFIRSLESWKTVLLHAFKRARPVIYSEGVAFIGRFASLVSGGRAQARRRFGTQVFASERDPEARFKFLIATQYLLSVYDDVWAIRMMKLILRVIGVKVTLATAASDRNFHAILGSKLNDIPTIGILHGVASRYYNMHDFTPGFDGEKMLSIDKYGLWSEWWKEYYLKYSKAYKPEQLFVSGPMRPLERKKGSDLNADSKDPTLKPGPIKVLFLAGQLTVPQEALPYLLKLVENKDLSVCITFRTPRDDFEKWLRKRHPEVLEKVGQGNILYGNIHNIISQCDVVVGSYSTGVLEALLQLKIPIFFRTQKWGDYYSLKEYDDRHSFFAENPTELIEKINNARSVSIETLRDLQERYFGDPHKNGSKWVVEQAEKILFQ
ncbi:MAG: hypothetical protein Q8P21_00050 [bacterium]|nr:hypothetical protein [bacterium]